VRSTAAPYTESRLAHLVRNKCVGFPVVEQYYFTESKAFSRNNLIAALGSFKRVTGMIYKISK
jgi:hypothetical protein